LIFGENVRVDSNDKLKNECKIRNENKQGWTPLIIRGLTEIKLIILSFSKITYCVKESKI